MIEPTRFNPIKGCVEASNIPIDNFTTPYNINLNTSEFQSVVDTLIKDYKIDEIIETGTYNGLGSTSIFAKTNKYVFTIECNYNNYITASKNLAMYDNVCVIHGLSCSRNRLIRALIKEDFDIDTTYDSKYPKSFYMKEVLQQVVVEEALELLCDNENKQLIFLDSAGGVGHFEFLNVMKYHELYLENKILMLDDISHIKHIRSVKWLEDKGYVVNKSSDNRFAWCDLSTNKKD